MQIKLYQGEYIVHKGISNAKQKKERFFESNSSDIHDVQFKVRHPVGLYIG